MAAYCKLGTFCQVWDHFLILLYFYNILCVAWSPPVYGHAARHPLQLLQLIQLILSAGCQQVHRPVQVVPRLLALYLLAASLSCRRLLLLHLTLLEGLQPIRPVPMPQQCQANMSSTWSIAAVQWCVWTTAKWNRTHAVMMLRQGRLGGTPSARQISAISSCEA